MSSAVVKHTPRDLTISFNRIFGARVVADTSLPTGDPQPGSDVFEI